MSQTTTPPNAPEVDVLSWIDEQVRLFFTGGHPNSIRAANRKRADAARTAVAELLTREAALVARNAELRAERDDYRDDYRKVLDVGVNVVADRDRLANENKELQENAAAERSRGIMDAQDLLHEISSKHRSAAATAFAQELLNALMQKYAETQSATRAAATAGDDAT